MNSFGRDDDQTNVGSAKPIDQTDDGLVAVVDGETLVKLVDEDVQSVLGDINANGGLARRIVLSGGVPVLQMRTGPDVGPPFPSYLSLFA